MRHWLSVGTESIVSIRLRYLPLFVVVFFFSFFLFEEKEKRSNVCFFEMNSWKMLDDIFDGEELDCYEMIVCEPIYRQ